MYKVLKQFHFSLNSFLFSLSILNMDSNTKSVFGLAYHQLINNTNLVSYKKCSFNTSLTQSNVGFLKVSLHYKLKPNKSRYPESQSECVSVSHDLWMFTFLIPLPLVEHWGRLK